MTARGFIKLLETPDLVFAPHGSSMLACNYGSSDAYTFMFYPYRGDKVLNMSYQNTHADMLDSLLSWARKGMLDDEDKDDLVNYIETKTRKFFIDGERGDEYYTVRYYFKPSGRLWIDRKAIAFWCKPHEVTEENIEDINEYLRQNTKGRFRGDVRDYMCWFVGYEPNELDPEFTLRDAMAGLSPDKDEGLGDQDLSDFEWDDDWDDEEGYSEAEKELMRMQHLSPEAKKAALKDRPKLNKEREELDRKGMTQAEINYRRNMESKKKVHE